MFKCTIVVFFVRIVAYTPYRNKKNNILANKQTIQI